MIETMGQGRQALYTSTINELWMRKMHACKVFKLYWDWGEYSKQKDHCMETSLIRSVKTLRVRRYFKVFREDLCDFILVLCWVVFEWAKNLWQCDKNTDFLTRMGQMDLSCPHTVQNEILQKCRKTIPLIFNILFIHQQQALYRKNGLH